MTETRMVKTNFTAGEISPQLLGRGDLRAYDNGAKTLKNVSIFPTGGLTRRYGTYYIDTALGNGRLISFEFNDDQAYLLVVTDLKLTIYRQGLQVTQLDSPWTVDQIKNLTWTQSADTVLLCHPDVPPKKLLRLADTSWSLGDWRYTKADTSDASLQPYYKYADDLVTLTPSATTGTITVTASDDVFTDGHVNTYLKITNENILVTAVLSPTVVTATVIETLDSTAPTVDWAEQSFSPVHGYPIAAAFHQDRLVIGGSRDLPNRLWLSRSGDFWNFDKGTGLDDEGIEFGLFSDQINAIKAVFSGRNLQIFTSGAEWIITGTPLTPTNIQLVRQTRVGSITDRYVPPVDVDGATLFAGKTGQELIEFVYTYTEDAYESNDLALLARHFLINPVDQCFDPLQRILYMPLADGTAAALTIYRTQDVYAWSRIETTGTILSVATVGSSVYVLIERQNNLYFIERFDEGLFVDAALSGETQNPSTIWSGLEHLNNCDVMVIGDGDVIGIKTVIDNQLVLEDGVRSLTVGLPYTQVIEPLPPSVLSISGAGKAMRLVKVIFRLMETSTLQVDTGRGIKSIPLQRFNQNVLDQLPPAFSGDVSVSAFGWTQDNTQPLWRLEQETPLPCTILGVTTELSVNE
jgi:hypothetical protein